MLEQLKKKGKGGPMERSEKATACRSSRHRTKLLFVLLCREKIHARGEVPTLCGKVACHCLQKNKKVFYLHLEGIR